MRLWCLTQKSIGWDAADGSSLRSKTYTHDDNDAVRTTNNGVDLEVEEAKSPALRSEFAYDARDYLTREEHVTPGLTTSQDYEYGASGLRERQVTDGLKAITYGYDPGHKLTTRGSDTLTWDAYGRVIQDHRGQ